MPDRARKGSTIVGSEKVANERHSHPLQYAVVQIVPTAMPGRLDVGD